MSSEYSKLSPYYTTPLKGSYLDIAEIRNFLLKTDDVTYEITSQYEFRPDLLAYDLYGDSNLWWVFSIRNKDNLKDPIYDFYAGQIIRLPQLETLKKSLGF